ncbi:hypothetical protein [Piscinibacter koreensis]|uniref:Uncharacterized protein n=1 Tax=Piscinibacter koreensis TaxID=2742824 RepID=A0A7Y6TZG9_9BURK|nr:hypothetical protein [Schlegelella koreensis]NUZ09137.1 hypothetical protein [Schlegelella koreensis]
MKASAIALFIVGAAVASGSVAKGGSHYISGHVTKSGTYVPPSMATNPNSTMVDNYSSKGNVNPYSGRVGTKDPYAVTAPSPKK